MLRAAAILLTALTGLSGLVYEVTWQKYLASLLGSQGEATAAVLGLFLAGLCAGYALFGRFSRAHMLRANARGQPPRLLWVYAAVEAGVGLYALGFPWIFELVHDLSTRLPSAGEAGGFAVDITLCALLIGPPTLLMGGTIPILTQALSRNSREATRVHAVIYSSNTAGAFAGALLAGFGLIPALGLSGAMRWVAILNLGAAAAFAALGTRWRESSRSDVPPRRANIDGFATCAAAALLTGFAMMAIQTVLIRLGGLSLGSSEFTFSMVVAVFVLCIALGSLLVSALPRIPLGALAINQWAIVALLYWLYEPLGNTPYWAHTLRSLFRNHDSAFLAYHMTVGLAMLLAIGPAVILSGATLPLLFDHLRGSRGDLGSLAGRLYSWSTLGSLFGALLGGYALLFWLDLHEIYRLSLGALAVAAVLVTVRLFDLSRWVSSAAMLAPIAIALLLLEAWDPHILTAGLFRQRAPQGWSYRGVEFLRQIRSGVAIPFYEDGPTASVAVVEQDQGRGRISRSIIVNGKNDGSTRGDYATASLVGLVPALLADRAERAFVVGLGTGITAGELAALDSMREVTVAEISRGVVNALPFFDFANLDAGGNSRIEIVRGDAYRALLRSEKRYDLIVSEPSNPWVAGVEMLYSREFLQAARSRLRPGGVYATWYHLYETDARCVAVVLRTYAAVFDRIAVWYANRGNLIVLGFEGERDVLSLEPIAQRVAQSDYSEALERAGVEGLAALLAHEVIPLGVIDSAAMRGPVHTLNKPILSHHAARAFFRGAKGTLPFTGFGEAARVGTSNSLLSRYRESVGGELPAAERAAVVAEACENLHTQCATLLARWQHQHPDSRPLARALAGAERRSRRFGGPIKPELVDRLATLYAAPETADDPRDHADYRTYYQHSAPFDPERGYEARAYAGGR